MTLLLALAAILVPLLSLPVLYPNREQVGYE